MAEAAAMPDMGKVSFCERISASVSVEGLRVSFAVLMSDFCVFHPSLTIKTDVLISSSSSRIWISLF